jgi:hypothetical protein
LVVETCDGVLQVVDGLEQRGILAQGAEGAIATAPFAFGAAELAGRLGQRRVEGHGGQGLQVAAGGGARKGGARSDIGERANLCGLGDRVLRGAKPENPWGC